MGMKALFRYCVDVLRGTVQHTRQDPRVYTSQIPKPRSKTEYTQGVITVLKLLVDALARVKSSTRRTITMLVFNIISAGIHSLLGRQMRPQAFLLSTAFAFACSSSIDLYNLWMKFNYGERRDDGSSSWFSPLHSLSKLVTHAHDEVIEHNILTSDGRYTVVYNLLALWRSDNLEAFDEEIEKLKTVGAEYPNRWAETIDLALALGAKESIANFDVFQEMLLEQRMLAVAKNRAPVVDGSSWADEMERYDEEQQQQGQDANVEENDDGSTPQVSPEERYTTRTVDTDAMLQNIDLEYDRDVFKQYNAFRTYRRGIIVQQRAREQQQRILAQANSGGGGESRWKVPSISVPTFSWGRKNSDSALWDRATLEQLTRPELQAVAKEYEIPGNITSKRIIDKLLERNAARSPGGGDESRWKVPSISVPTFSWGRKNGDSALWDRATLEQLTRPELQAVAKEHEIPRNITSKRIIDELLERNAARSPRPSADTWDRAALEALSYRQLQDIAMANSDRGIAANQRRDLLVNSIVAQKLPKTATPPASPRTPTPPARPSQHRS